MIAKMIIIANSTRTLNITALSITTIRIIIKRWDTQDGKNSLLSITKLSIKQLSIQPDYALC
jgi:hypothetical protein